MATLREAGKGNGKLEAYGIDPRTIVIKEGFNARDTTSPEAKKHIAWLKTSIAERGVDEPIWIENTGSEFVLIDGHCRVLALRQLWEEGKQVYVPTISYKGDEAAVLAKSLISNNGLALTQLELGNAAERLSKYGWGIEKIAALMAPHLGFTPKKAERHVKDAIEIHQAPLQVKEMVKNGVAGVKVSVPVAIQEVRKNREQAPARIKEQAAAAQAKGKTELKRPKNPGPATKVKLDKEAALDAARTMADALDIWVEDATDKTERKVINALKAFRQLVPAQA